MSAFASQAELRLTVGRLLELAYNKDEGVTGKLVRQAGSLKLSVDADGRATLSGQAGLVAFSASEALQQIGARIRFVTVLMTVDDAGSIRYTATFKTPHASIAVLGSIDVEKLITHCSGLLCRAARALQGRPAHLDRELDRAMGH